MCYSALLSDDGRPEYVLVLGRCMGEIQHQTLCLLIIQIKKIFFDLNKEARDSIIARDVCPIAAI